ncbi:MAG: hypothetical protein P1V97_32550, partial [Planctomycetota bacterium]|nr:hypothetical protein [Planctomycetota bacterium]
MRRSLVRAHNKGIALLLVIAVIVALVIIATPFALSMRMHERSSLRYDASGRARHIAKAGRGLAINQLINSHSSIESQGNANDHEFDGLGEFILDNGAIQGLSSLTQNDAQGEMYKVDIADELGKLDINTASP